MHDEHLNDALSVEALESELTTLAGHLNAGSFRFLRLLAEFARREGYAGFGIASCAHWLSWKCGFGLVAAREKVRVARALEALPLISEAMRLGTLSYCKARAITRVATPANESLLLSIAENGTVTHVEKTVRLFQQGLRAEELEAANARHADRYAQCYFDERGQLILRAQLPPEQGALFMKALEAAAEALWEADDASREASSGQPREDAAARKADALALMAETVLAHGASGAAAGDRHLVTVHVAEEVLRDPSAAGACHVEGQAPLPPATVRRLCCDGSLVAIVEDGEGAPLSATRKTRVVPSAMRRALVARDGGCRFPACTHRRFVDAHHIVHWADGGDTTLDNLTLLCRKHHRFLHEYGFELERVGSELRFCRPDGQYVPDVPRLRGCESDAGCAELHAVHADEALNIGAHTAVCRWNGESPRYDGIVAFLQERSGLSPVGTKRQSLHVKRSAQQEAEEACEREENEQMLRDQRVSSERSRSPFMMTELSQL